jgi:hypothetical protein
VGDRVSQSKIALVDNFECVTTVLSGSAEHPLGVMKFFRMSGMIGKMPNILLQGGDHTVRCSCTKILCSFNRLVAILQFTQSKQQAIVSNPNSVSHWNRKPSSTIQFRGFTSTF